MIHPALRTVMTVAANELSDSIRSRRVLVMILLYLAGSVTATLIFLYALHGIEHQLVETLGLTATAKTGGVTATLWKSASFRSMLTGLIGDATLAERLLTIPPLGLFYAWISFTFAPTLVILTSATRVSEEISSGSIRYVTFRASRLQWLLGKFAGQAVQLLAALLLSALGAWLTGLFRMQSFEPLATALAMLVFSVKAWIYALTFLGLATAISQLCAAPNLALAMGFLALIALAILSGVSEHLAGDGWSRLWDIVNVLTPQAHRLDLWWNSWSRVVPAVIFLLALSMGYLFAGYARFSRRDL